MRELSINIVSRGGIADARKLFDKAVAYYDTGVVNEGGELIVSDYPTGGCVQVFVWSDEDGAL